jgi:hypothetical protein
MSITLGFDATHQFISQLPAGCQAAGYDTGGGSVAWTEADWAAHPGAVHIDQDPGAGDGNSDVLDCENGAVPVGSPEIPLWVKRAQAAWNCSARPGQRTPVLYCSASNVTANINALASGGVSSGAGLWIADWTGTDAQAIAEIIAASGPFPVIGGQFQDLGDIDADVWSTTWLQNVSGAGAWVFGPVRNANFRPGKTTFGATWDSPGIPQPLAVGSYQLAVFEGSRFPGTGPQLPGYPLSIPAYTHSYEGYGIPPGTTISAGIRAVATDGGHAGPWVSGTVTPGS